jgi:lipopolysaccharide biosynthesis glycosyltransferase
VPDRFAQVIAHTTPHQLGKWHSGKEFGIDFESRSYMSGQLLINCAMWRSWALTEKMCDFVENTGALDMLTLNVFCAGRVHELGREWCISANYDEVPSNARLLHWHGTAKPWAEKCKNQKYYDIYAGGVQ